MLTRMNTFLIYSSDEDRLFFIYDGAALDDQDADIKDSVLYCFPKLVSSSILI